MLIFEFNDVNELSNWREDFVKRFNEVPRITAKIVNGEHIFLARVSM